MKTFILAVACIACTGISRAQLKSTPYCPPFNIDILDGNVNKLYAQSPYGDVKNRLPCFTDAIDELQGSGCGGVFFKDKGVYFYTYRNYIEIRDNYTGTMTFPLMGADRGSLFKWIGLPKVKDNAWEVYQMRYGILVVYFTDGGKINRLILSNKSAETLRLCE